MSVLSVRTWACWSSVENLGPGMAVAIVQPAGNDGPLRRNARQELRPRGRDAAVMADLEQRAGEIGLAKHRLLDRPFRVAFQ